MPLAPLTANFGSAASNSVGGTGARPHQSSGRPFPDKFWATYLCQISGPGFSSRVPNTAPPTGGRDRSANVTSSGTLDGTNEPGARESRTTMAVVGTREEISLLLLLVVSLRQVGHAVRHVTSAATCGRRGRQATKMTPTTSTQTTATTTTMTTNTTSNARWQQRRRHTTSMPTEHCLTNTSRQGGVKGY